MSATNVIPVPSTERVLPLLTDALSQNVRAWTEACWNFFEWERGHILVGSPTAAEQEQHRSTLRELLLGTRLLLTLVSTSDLRDSITMVKELEGRLVQLEESWSVAHNPLSEADAKAVLSAAFPGDKQMIEQLFA